MFAVPGWRCTGIPASLGVPASGVDTLLTILGGRGLWSAPNVRVRGNRAPGSARIRPRSEAAVLIWAVVFASAADPAPVGHTAGMDGFRYAAQAPTGPTRHGRLGRRAAKLPVRRARARDHSGNDGLSLHRLLSGPDRSAFRFGAAARAASSSKSPHSPPGALSFRPPIDLRPSRRGAHGCRRPAGGATEFSNQ